MPQAAFPPSWTFCGFLLAEYGLCWPMFSSDFFWELQSLVFPGQNSILNWPRWRLLHSGEKWFEDVQSLKFEKFKKFEEFEEFKKFKKFEEFEELKKFKKFEKFEEFEKFEKFKKFKKFKGWKGFGENLKCN